MDFQNDTDEMFAVESMEDYEPINLDDLEAKLDEELENSLNDLELLKEQKDIIENPVALGEVVKDVIWEQVCNQIGIKQGKDFIAENHGNTLDLRNEAHIQTTENFAKGKIAEHNYISKDQLEQNYDRYKNKPHKEFRDEYVDPCMDATLKRAGELKKEGIDTVTDIYTGRQIPTETKLENGKNNPEAAQREHVKSSAELYDNPSLQMANGNEELAGIINNPENLQGYTTAERNNRKSDKSADEMSNQDKTKHWEKANEKADEYIKQEEKKGEDRLKQEGRKTQKEEAFRITKTAVRAVILQMLADLVKTMISKLVEWFRQKGKSFKTLLHSMKEAIHLFVCDLKNEVLTAGGTLATTIATAIFGPIVGIFKKIGMLLKQGWNSLKEAFSYLKSPKTKNQPFSITVLEVGKIIMAGLSATGALALGEVIEKGLMTIPIFVFEIPLFGSLANILGIFFGAIVAGIIGAIVLNWIDRLIEKKIMRENIDAQIKKGNEILNLQHQIQVVGEAKLERTKSAVANNIRNRHVEAANTMKDSFENIKANCAIDRSIQDTFNDIDVLFDKLED